MTTQQDDLEFVCGRILVGDGCWEWGGKRDSSGYGQIRRKRGSKARAAHRVVYELLVGPIADGMQLDHLCRNKACVKPCHLEPVTNRENMLRGESPAAQRARATECAQGHEFTPENTVRYPNGERSCRTCRKAYDRSHSRQRDPLASHNSGEAEAPAAPRRRAA